MFLIVPQTKTKNCLSNIWYIFYGDYVEKLIMSKSNMMALAAMDATFISAPHFQSLLLTPRNIQIGKVSGRCNVHTHFAHTLCPSTTSHIQVSIDNSMANDDGIHHDSH